MSGDEAFIRAVVDNPGDDTPRLVYADWLDDRDDPRGPYLRAEHAWAERPTKAGQKKLRAAAEDLDPVWVARVGRPPVGVCCAHLRLSATEWTASPADLDAAEESLDVTLPPQLRALLLNYNLGHLRGGPFVAPGPRTRSAQVEAFACLEDSDFTDGVVSHELADRTDWVREEYGLDWNFVYLASTFADDTDFVVSCPPDGNGSVYLMDGYRMLEDPEGGLALVADSIGAFLATLQPRTWPPTDA